MTIPDSARAPDTPDRREDRRERQQRQKCQRIVVASKFSLIVSISGRWWQMITVQVWIDGKDKEIFELDANAKCIDVKNLVAEKHYRGVSEITIVCRAEEVADDVLLKDLDLGSSNWLVCSFDKIIDMGRHAYPEPEEMARGLYEIVLSSIQPAEDFRPVVMASFQALMDIVMTVIQRASVELGQAPPVNVVILQVVSMLGLDVATLFESYRENGELGGGNDGEDGNEEDGNEEAGNEEPGF